MAYKGAVKGRKGRRAVSLRKALEILREAQLFVAKNFTCENESGENHPRESIGDETNRNEAGSLLTWHVRNKG